ncbi:universal stress protein [Thiomicrorhabdus sp. ZW0627]|uniref:universal stress protein n=1 Tax=Thiomicrorhabdus sp. ZW0627 TaxID=3039774 RepID=UPI00243672D2|nr:universal stress protein [Thiomicrorhabdus sp. ZW0627]MDG6772986.1 universal stress protein [Thiomicrorhabdus sp. ZW0627]
MHNYQTILVAVDFSKHSDVALSRAIQLSQLYNASIRVIHVVEIPTYPVLEDVAVTGLPGVWDVELTQTLMENANKKMSALMELCGLSQNHASVINGIASDTIVSTAEEIDADIIVMGKYGLSGWKRLLGSTTDSVMHRSPCDVLAVKIDE